MPLLFNSSQADKHKFTRTSFSGADIRAVALRPSYNIANLPGDWYPNSEAYYHELGAIQTLSLSIFRDKREVRSLGFQHAMGYTRGTVTLAGSLIFALLDRHPFNDDGSGYYDTNLSGNKGLLRSSSGGFIRDLVGREPTVRPVEQNDRCVRPPVGSFSTEATEATESSYGRRHQYDFSWDSQVWSELMYTHELPPFDIIITFANEAGGVGIMKLHGVDIHHEGMTLSIEDLFSEVTYSYTARAATMFEEGVYQGRLWSGPQRPFENDYALARL